MVHPSFHSMDEAVKTTRRIFSYLKQYKLLASAQLSCAIISLLMIFVFPETAKRMVRDIIENDSLSETLKQKEAWILVSITVLAFFLRDLCNFLRILANNTFEQAAIFDLRSKLYSKLQRLPLPWFDNRRTGDIMTRVAEDVPAMERLLIDGLEQGLLAILQVTFVTAYLMYTDMTLAFAAIIPMPFILTGAIFYTKNARHRYRNVKKFTGDMNSILNDNVAGIRQIKSFAAENKEQIRFDQASHKVRKATIKVMKAWAIYNPSMSFLNSLGYSAVLGVGAWRIMEGKMEVAEYLAFFTILWALYEPIGRLHQLNQIAQSSIAAAERVFAIIDTDDETHSFDGKEIKLPINGHVVFDKVNFGYHDANPTISEVSMEAKPGQTIALVGSTGAGKSTLVNLLTRFYDYNSGEITVDGQPVHELNKPSLRDVIGYVTQEPFLFNGTIRDNLILAKQHASDEEMWQALQAANADQFVERYQDGLETQIGERGVKLSGGEKQRLSIARALLKNPPILILDEATASVDSNTEKLIQEALDRLLEKRTAFVIAHRLSTIQNADCIHVLERGKIIESGTHDQLINQNGKYADLSKQSFLSETKAN